MEKEIMYVCPKCLTEVKGNGIIPQTNCPSCGTRLVSSNITPYVWHFMTNEEKENVKKTISTTPETSNQIESEKQKNTVNKSSTDSNKVFEGSNILQSHGFFDPRSNPDDLRPVIKQISQDISEIKKMFEFFYVLTIISIICGVIFFLTLLF